MRTAVALLLEFLGFACLVFGAWALAHWFGFVIGGLVLLLIGNSLDRGGA